MHISPGNLLAPYIYFNLFILIIDRRNCISGAVSYTSAAFIADCPRFNNRIRFQFCIGKYGAQSDPRTEFPGQKHFRMTHFAYSCAYSQKSYTAGNIMGNLAFSHRRMCRGSFRYSRVMGHSLPAVIFYETSQFICKSGPENSIQPVVCIKGIIVPMSTFFDTPVGTSGNSHGNNNY